MVDRVYHSSSGKEIKIPTVSVVSKPIDPTKEVVLPSNNQLPSNYTFYQNTASTEWVVLHNLGRYPAVTIIDSSGAEVDCDIVHDSANLLRVLPGVEFSGRVILT